MILVLIDKNWLESNKLLIFRSGKLPIASVSHQHVISFSWVFASHIKNSYYLLPAPCVFVVLQLHKMTGVVFVFGVNRVLHRKWELRITRPTSLESGFGFGTNHATLHMAEKTAYRINQFTRMHWLHRATNKRNISDLMKWMGHFSSTTYEMWIFKSHDNCAFTHPHIRSTVTHTHTVSLLQSDLRPAEISRSVLPGVCCFWCM